MVDAGESVEAKLHTIPNRTTIKEEDTPARIEIVGDSYLLMTLASELGLDSILSNVFGEHDGKALLALAIFQVVEGRALYLAEEWLKERPLPSTMRGESISREMVYSLVNRCGADIDARERFFEECLKRFPPAPVVISDTTSISTYSPNLEAAEFGYNRDGEQLPQINLNLVAEQNSGLPVWYRALPGSIPDVSTLKCSATMLNELGLKSFSFSLDRGFYSQANFLSNNPQL
jgi:hypothetical protein